VHGLFGRKNIKKYVMVNFEYIKVLSERDKKDLASKTVKVAEEAGELAKKILPFISAPGSHHKISSRSEVLVEVVDTCLAALSIACELGFSEDEIREVFTRKTIFWQELQSKEEQVTFPLPYEIHITVKNPESLEHFSECCKNLGVKPIMLDLESTSGQIVMLDSMTSSVFLGDNTGAISEVGRISDGLTAYGYQVIREKIETVPWHPAAPSKKYGGTMPKNCYFESHIAVIITPEYKSALGELAASHGAHLSKNFMKKLENGRFTNMVTLRSYEGFYENFQESVVSLKMALSDAGFYCEKEIIEFSIYDTKISHDVEWLTKH